MPAERYFFAININGSLIKRFDMLHINGKRTMNPYKIYQVKTAQYGIERQSQYVYS